MSIYQGGWHALTGSWTCAKVFSIAGDDVVQQSDKQGRHTFSSKSTSAVWTAEA